MKIAELLESIRKRDVVLPEFQREYVWGREQAKKLVGSLMHDYPVGSLLFWKTDEPPDLKNITKLPEKLGTIQVVLDGQQRLTTLFMLLVGEIPPYYQQKDIETDPRDLCFNLETTELAYYLSSRMKDDPLWHRVVDCFTHEIDIFRIAQARTTGDAAFRLANQLHDNLNRLRNIRNTDLAVQFVPPSAKLDEAIDIFDRVNSLGTKLTDAELALTHVTGKWAGARRVMKEKSQELSTRGFAFDLSFMTRALTAVVTRHALFEAVHDKPKAELLKGWETLTKILDYLVTLLPARAFIHSVDDLNTTNVLIPLVAYLAQNDGRFPDDRTMKHALHHLYAASMWQRYTSQTDQRLEYDVSVVVREPWPWKALCNQIIDQRGRIEVKPSDFEGRNAQHPLYRMAYILAKAQGAVDWANGAPLVPANHGAAYQLHSHHIFPQALLYRSGFEAENHLHRKKVNEIANRVFLTADTNFEISDTPPSDYLPSVDKNFPGALVKQFVPMSPALWGVDAYEDFLAARRQLIALKLNEFLTGLVTEPEVVHARPISETVSLGESATLEFKSTLQWDVVQGKQNKDLRFSVLKTIAAFLNSNGGTLVIGVEDSGNAFGLEQDFKLAGGDRDGFEQLLVSLIRDHIGIEVANLVRVRFEALDSRQVCVVDVDIGNGPAFVKGAKEKDFYVRLGNTTRALDREETVKYIQANWAQ